MISVEAYYVCFFFYRKAYLVGVESVSFEIKHLGLISTPTGLFLPTGQPFKASRVTALQE